jgi:hypothetical protein
MAVALTLAAARRLGEAERFIQAGRYQGWLPMASLAAVNVTAILMGYPVWNRDDISPFLEGGAPKTAPSILNAQELWI